MKSLLWSMFFFAIGYTNNVWAEVLEIPSDPKAHYRVLEVDGPVSGRTIVVNRIGSSGSSYSKRLVNCINYTQKYLGVGDTIEQMEQSPPDEKMMPPVTGSIAYYIMMKACS